MEKSKLNYRLIGKALKTLENRLEYLEERATNYGSATSYDKAEITALKIAIPLMVIEKTKIHDKYLRERNGNGNK